MSYTAIEDLKPDREIKDEPVNLDDNNVSRVIVDMIVPLEMRILALNRYYQLFGTNETIETVNKLCMMYEISKVKSLKNYLWAICEKSTIDPFLKSIAAKTLWLANSADPLAYQALDLIYPQLDQNVGTPYRIELLQMLMDNESYTTKTEQYFNEVINNLLIDCQYRYGTILSLECRPSPEETKEEAVQREIKQKRRNIFIKSACKVFLQQTKNLPRFRVLAGQNLMIKKHEPELVEQILLEIAENSDIDYNIRADATDVLLNYGLNTKQRAQKLILELGIGKKSKYTIYDNAQNVHSEQIEDSVNTTIEFLHEIELVKINNEIINYDYVRNAILELGQNQKEALELALTRIYLDRALYSRYNYTLLNILLKVWSFSQNHSSQSEIRKRLVEELVEMSQTCSSGYVSRLINSISGFGDFGIRISWRDQILANLTGRLNSRIRELDNLKLQEKILIEMTLENSDLSGRKNFLKFLRTHLSDIREEMYNEFKSHISDTDFDLYFGSAITMWECG